MKYKLLFFCLVWFLIGRISVDFKIYIGDDPVKYDRSTIGILLHSNDKEK